MQTSTYEADKHTAQGGMDFEREVRQLRKRIQHLAYRSLHNIEDAEDVTQETFARAWKHHARFDAGRSFDAWVTRIAVNLCIDITRRRRRQPTVSLNTPPAWAQDSEPEGYQVADSTQDPSQRLLDTEVGETLQRALDILPAPYRRCMQLLKQNHSYEEISNLLGCPLGTVRSRVHRARRMIPKRLETK